MAYNNQCAATVGGCTRLQYFSNPMVTYTDGFAMGDGPARNNALTLNKSANAVSNYRPTVVPVMAPFADVPIADRQFGYVEFMYQAGFTNGCNTGPLRYCPDSPVTRGEMAAFLERSKRGAPIREDAHGHGVHRRPRGGAFRGLYRAAVCRRLANGCGAGSCLLPDGPVTRAEMAKFLLKTKCGAAYTPTTPAVEPLFRRRGGRPVPAVCQEALRLGITLGCATSPTLQYCPNDAVTRGTMAVFIYRTFPYVAPSEVCTP